MEKTPEEKVAVEAEKEKRDGGVYDEYSCSNILICKYPLREVIRAIFFKCFGFETPAPAAAAAAAACSDQSCSCSTADVKDIDPPPPCSAVEPVPLPCPPSSTPGPTEDMSMRFRPPPRRPPTRGSGPETNSSGNS